MPDKNRSACNKHYLSPALSTPASAYIGVKLYEFI